MAKNSKASKKQSTRQLPSDGKYVARRKRDTDATVEQDSCVTFAAPEEIFTPPTEQPISKKQAKINEKQRLLDLRREKINTRFDLAAQQADEKKQKQLADIVQYQAVLNEKCAERAEKLEKRLQKQSKALEKLKSAKKASKQRIREEQEKLERIAKKNKSTLKRAKEKIKSAIHTQRTDAEELYKNQMSRLDDKRASALARLERPQAKIDAMQSALDLKLRRKRDKENARAEKSAARNKCREDNIRAKAETAENKKRAEYEKQKARTTLNFPKNTDDPQAIAEYMKKLEDIESWNRKFSSIMLKIGMAIFAAAAVFAILWNTEAARVSVEGRECYELSVNAFGMTYRIRDVDTAAMLKEEKINAASVPFAVFRLIDDMYGDEQAQSGGEIIHIGVYGAKPYTAIFERRDFSSGRADMHVSRVLRTDRRYAKKSGATIGRCALIREYTEKYGGEYDSNFESLKSVPLAQIIYRDRVTDEAAQAVGDIFNIFTNPNDVPMVIIDGSTPMPSSTPVAANKSGVRTTSKPTAKTSGSGAVHNDKSSNTKTSSTSPTPTESVSAPTSAPTAAPTAMPTAVSTPKPLAPIKEVARPTANPTNN